MNNRFLTVLLVLLFTANIAGQDSWIWIWPEGTFAQTEQTIEFSVESMPTLLGVKAIHLDIDFDPLIVTPILNQIVPGSLFMPDDTITFFDVYLSPGGNRLTIDIAVLTDSATVNGGGSIVIFPMVTVANGETDIVIAGIDVRDRFNNSIPVQGIDGWIKVCPLVGDVNASGGVDVADVTYLVDYLFRGGPPPTPMLAGDTDCSGEPEFPVNVADLTTLVDYLFRGGTLCTECL